MIILEPVTMTDALFTRASTATYYDADGILQTAAIDELRVTYDPGDLAELPTVLLESAVTNLMTYSEDLSNAAWTKTRCTVSANAATAPDGTLTADKLVEDGTAANNHYIYHAAAVTGLLTYTWAVYAKAAERTWLGFSIYDTSSHFTYFDLTTGAVGTNAADSTASIEELPNGWWRLTVTRTNNAATTVYAELFLAEADNDKTYSGDSASGLYLWGLQLELGSATTSYIPTVAATVTRAADVVGSATGTMLSSNVQEDDHLPYDVLTSYSLGDFANDNTSHLIYQSLANANLGNPLTDATKWLSTGATNRWKMLDAYNNTQTSYAELIALSIRPKQIAQGLFLGGLDGNSIDVIVEDATEGVVYTESESLIISDSASSHYNWAFNRIRRKTYFVTTLLPVYSDATVTVLISKAGGTAKCGMFSIGPLSDIGISLMGLSTEIKDYSTTRFNFDGTSETTQRGFAKLMSVDLVIDNQLIDSVQERLADYRQTPVVWIGSTAYGSTIAYGKYTSFKNVIEGPNHSKMALQIQGIV